MSPIVIAAVSSANFGLISLGMSSAAILNNIGPKTVPADVPDVLSSHSPTRSLTLILAFLSLRKSAMWLRSFPSTPNLSFIYV